jgi:hypothetical protein
MSESAPQELKPFVCRTSAPNTPAGRAPSNRRVETKGDDRHRTFMLDVDVCEFTVEAVFAVEEISTRSRVERRLPRVESVVRVSRVRIGERNEDRLQGG